MKLGLFGGSFDPVHLGHLLVAQAAREELALTRLFFIPAAQSPFKPDAKPTPAPERLRLLRLALAGRDWCEIDEQELRRGGVSYTIDTVRDYAQRLPQAQLFYLIGADHAVQLTKWREAGELARLTEFVVIPRPIASPLLQEHIVSATMLAKGPPPLGTPPLGGRGSGTSQEPAQVAGPGELPAILPPKGGVPAEGHVSAPLPAPFRGRALIGFPLGVSSSQIRSRVKAGLPIGDLVPSAVAEAIRNNRLYI